MLNLVECNIFLAKKDCPLYHAGSSDEELSNGNITQHIKDVMEQEHEQVFERDELQFSLFPMKNNFECIGMGIASKVTTAFSSTKAVGKIKRAVTSP